MAKFELNVPVETAVPKVEVTVDINNPLPVGVHRFQLIVEDNSGNASAPSFVDVVVRDTQRPTAVLDTVGPIEAGNSFSLSGERSSDVPPGEIVKYIWTMVPALDRPVINNPDVLRDVVIRDRDVVTP